MPSKVTCGGLVIITSVQICRSHIIQLRHLACSVKPIQLFCSYFCVVQYSSELETFNDQRSRVNGICSILESKVHPNFEMTLPPK